MSETDNTPAVTPPDYGASVGDIVEYSLPEGTTIGGVSTFNAKLTFLGLDGKATLEFLPVGAESEPVTHEGVPNGPGSGQWMPYANSGFEHVVLE